MRAELTLSNEGRDLATTATTAVGLAASDEVIRRRLDTVLTRAGYSIVASGESAEQLIQAAAGSRVEVVVIAGDISLLQRNTGLNLIRRELPELPIVVVSSGQTPSAVRKALRAGAHGYVSESQVEGALPVTVQAVVDGHLCVPQALRHQVSSAVFSFREKQVLELVAMGYTNHEIAQRLRLSANTIKCHVSSIFRKLGVSSRAEAAAVVLDPESAMDIRVAVGSA